MEASALSNLGTRDEISFDVVSGREGCLRRKGTFWQCFFFAHADVEEVYHRTSFWKEGMRGHHFGVPRSFDINEDAVTKTIASILEMTHFEIVWGPDSLVLK